MSRATECGKEYLMGYGFSPSYAIQLQRESTTPEMAKDRIARSCRKCCETGSYKMDCDRCPVDKSHHDQIEYLREMYQQRKMKQQQKMEQQQRNDELKKKLDECIKMIEDIYETIYSPSQLDEHNDRLDELTDKWLRMKGGEV